MRDACHTADARDERLRLPLHVAASVRLDDAVAMNPARPLSAAAEIQIVVRLSLSGAAKAEPGDWQWQSAPIAVNEVDSPLDFTVELAAPAGKS